MRYQTSLDQSSESQTFTPAATMTTVIMISNDNSVIITNSDDSNLSTLSSHGQSVVKTPAKMTTSSSGDKPVNSRKSYQSRKLSVSTVDSDSEELNNSSSSTTSTLSSR